MRKIIAIAASMLILTSALAFGLADPTNTAGTGTFGTSYNKTDAAGSLSFTATNIGAGVTFGAKCSANVMLSLQSNGTGYVSATYHSSGNKYYGTGSGDSRIYMKEITGAATDAAEAPPTLADPVIWTGWTAVK